jgi:hypothetical protein
MKNEHTEHVTTTKARAGSSRPMTSHVLVIGTALVVVIFAIIFFIGSS